MTRMCWRNYWTNVVEDGRDGPEGGDQGDPAHAHGDSAKTPQENANKRLRIYVEAEKQVARERKLYARRSALRCS